MLRLLWTLTFHSFWLKTTVTEDNSECACKYCSKRKAQLEVNAHVLKETPTSTPPNRATTSGKRKGKGRVQEPESDQEMTLPIPPPRSKPGPSRQDAKFKQPRERFPFANAEVPNTAGYTARKRHSELHEGRTIRDGELVWIPLVQPIRHPLDPEVGIDYWPAFTYDVEFRKTVVYNTDHTSYTVKQQVMMVTRPLVCGMAVVKVEESLVVPFRAWDLDERFVAFIKRAPIPPNFSWASPSPIFKPGCCDGQLADGITFDLLAPYYALAVQTAAHMDKYWSPMYHVQPGPSRPGAFYQGLWLGAERIWLDDLVRIHPDHEELTTHHELSGKIEPPEQGSETRALFMRVTEIVVEDVQTSPGSFRKILRLAGPIYCSVPDKSYPFGPNDAAYLTPPQTNAISGVSNGIHFQMPIPPPGFRYKPVTLPNQEVVLDGMMIAGRYYPKLLWHPAFNLKYIQREKEEWWLTLVAMAGLAPGRFGRCNALYLMWTRREAAELSEDDARNTVEKMWGMQSQKRGSDTTRTQDYAGDIEMV